ncbi:L-histidine N(alpha)-methyltransferase [Marinagarivorans algicola]|uniref:L-histidine N(alpha)-methyltransferase n=1 Tax=Marinagarivorans algicola TaxID=1513270 RepID=UPI0006B534E0|nr:L-histidine N(alpha)-methyltransferase [Marinagarivorans algicola]
MFEQFAKDVDVGLSAQEKNLSSKYFYNKIGDELFVKIMNMPEYYLTRAELEIFTEKTDDMMAYLGLDNERHFELIELGAGDGTKTKKLLAAMNHNGVSYDYIPIDISDHALKTLVDNVSKDLPETSIKPKQGDYFECLNSLKKSDYPKVVLFLGSNIGNMPDDMACQFLQQLAANLKTHDKLLLGVDLIKPAAIVLPAYDDDQGITRAFNLNLLQRMNDELEAEFNLAEFEHAPEYDEISGVAKSYIQSKCEQRVAIKAIGKVYHFAEGEKIHTEISRKYSDKVVDDIISDTEFCIAKKMTDGNQYFADYVLNKR